MKNKRSIVVLFSLAVIVLTLVFFALPGQFATIYNSHNDFEGADLSAMGGYEFIFGGSKYVQNNCYAGKAMVSASGIAFIVLIVLAVVCYVFQKKSSALLLLAGIIMLVATILLFCVKGWINDLEVNHQGSSVGLWVPYLCASLLALSTIATLYVAISELVIESRQPYTPKKESYSYLKNK